jgi:pyridoxal phosphate enzyme (YggS family)
MSTIAENWRRVRAAVDAAAARAGRAASEVRVVAVSKTKPAEMIEEAITAGATDIGENYVQEAEEKKARVSAAAVWHMIGHLQRNKAKRALETFDVIQTLDSVALGKALKPPAERLGQPLRVLVEINLGAEASKSGLAPPAARSMLAALGAFAWLRVDGLMTIPPPTATAEAARPYFRSLRQLRDTLRADAPGNAPLNELSMGMSADFEVAVEEGATLVRIGQAIFGPRTPPAQAGA